MINERLQMTTHKVVRAIDLGFGFTKFIKSVSDKGVPKCLSFPSVTAIGSKKTLGGGVFSERDTVTVEHGGVQYEEPNSFITSREFLASIVDTLLTLRLRGTAFPARPSLPKC